MSDRAQADDAPAEGTVAGSMSLLEHLEEFRKRLLWSAVGVLVAFLSCWWWADALAALVLVPLVVREGLEAWRGECSCGHGDACHAETPTP